MKLYAVRLAQTKEPVGFFWTHSRESLFWMIDAYLSPYECEFVEVREESAIVWPNKSEATFGVDIDGEDENFNPSIWTAGAILDFDLQRIATCDIGKWTSGTKLKSGIQGLDQYVATQTGRA